MKKWDIEFRSVAAWCLGVISVVAIACNDPPVSNPNPNPSNTSSGLNGGAVGVYMRHYNLQRTGVNPNETVLTPANVVPSSFGKLGTLPVDGYVYAQPLYVPNVAISGQGGYNVLYVATEGDSLYAFDADSLSMTPLWKVTFTDPANGITNLSENDTNCTDQGPQIGILGTPTIDPATNTIYFVAATKFTAANGEVTYMQHLHALDIGSGAERANSPHLIEANDFDPLKSNQRPGLVLNNGKVYVAWSSNCDQGPYNGTILSFDATTLAMIGEFYDTEAGNAAGIWMSGMAPAVDTDGNLYVSTGNGFFDGGTNNFGCSVVKVQDSSGTLSLTDFFAPFDQALENNINNDLDISSGGIILLPDQAGAHPQELVAMGKTGQLYLIDRGSMGGYDPTDNTYSRIVQSFNMDGTAYNSGVATASGDNNHGQFGTPAFFNGKLYVAPVLDNIKAFTLTDGRLSAGPTDKTPTIFGWPGGTPSISANGTIDGILWYADNSRANDCLNRPVPCTTKTASRLLAFDVNNLAQGPLYDSDAVGGGDVPGSAAKHVSPTVVNGRVFLGTKTEVDVYGLR